MGCFLRLTVGVSRVLFFATIASVREEGRRGTEHLAMQGAYNCCYRWTAARMRACAETRKKAEALAEKRTEKVSSVMRTTRTDEQESLPRI
ncbi:hypothetical protein X777_07780 [Ooceraea biroi]|uniref:Secreted protein n=1 Tax=Ooceraea biroi TaxID=2015173 RepID=A0A026WZI1_OOCBI|nr:hypothetical protein X777_07780 [Ooceraea biroi]